MWHNGPLFFTLSQALIFFFLFLLLLPFASLNFIRRLWNSGHGYKLCSTVSSWLRQMPSIVLYLCYKRSCSVSRRLIVIRLVPGEGWYCLKVYQFDGGKVFHSLFFLDLSLSLSLSPARYLLHFLFSLFNFVLFCFVFFLLSTLDSISGWILPWVPSVINMICYENKNDIAISLINKSSPLSSHVQQMSSDRKRGEKSIDSNLGEILSFLIDR